MMVRSTQSAPNWSFAYPQLVKLLLVYCQVQLLVTSLCNVLISPHPINQSCGSAMIAALQAKVWQRFEPAKAVQHRSRMLH